MEPKILVTGANGYTGYYFAQYLAEKNIPVRAMYYPPDGEPDLAHDCIDLVPGDIRHRDQIRPTLEGIETVQHVAALYRPTNVRPQAFHDFMPRPVVIRACCSWSNSSTKRRVLSHLW